MTDQTNIQRKTEFYPFRRIAIASFIKGGISFVFGIIFLLLIKTELNKENYLGLSINLAAAISFLTIGIRTLWKGYLKEYNFSVKDIFDRTRNIKINHLLAQRANNEYQLAEEYIRLFDSRNLSYSDKEKGKVKNWQFIFFKIVSKKGLSDIFDYVPYQITNFIKNQSRPISIFGVLVLAFAFIAFIAYLDIVELNLFWINLAVLIGLLAFWQPSKVEYLTSQTPQNPLWGKLLLFTILYVLTILFYQPDGYSKNIILFIIILLLFGLIAYTALLSFKIVEDVFGARKKIDVELSDIDLKTMRVATQPSNIKQQFENILKKSTGWYFSYDYDKENRSGEVRGKQKHKGDFSFTNVYESNPEIISTVYDSEVESKLSKIYLLGLILLSVGLALIFLGLLIFPRMDASNLDHLNNPQIVQYANGFLTSLFLTLIGIALLSFGNRLVYEIFMFFNSEVFFESSLILLRAYGSYDEYEHIMGGIKRKDTFSDFTPDIEVCQIKSSIFVHPYLESKNIQRLPRYVVQVTRNDGLLNFLIDEFRNNLTPYLMQLDSGANLPRVEDKDIDGTIEESND